jgi:hypothetical protein
LLDRLRFILFKAERADTADPVAIDFRKVLRRRWEPYDEITELARALRAKSVFGDNSTSVLDCVVATVKRSRSVVWADRTPKDFCVKLEETFSKSVVNLAYWELFVAGFFQALDIEHFFSGEGNTWRQGVEFAKFAPRGLRLIERLQPGGWFLRGACVRVCEIRGISRAVRS